MTKAESVPRITIIGGGFGGLSAAKALGKHPVKVTLIDKSNHHLFQPLLYQVATAGLSPANIAAPIRGILKTQSNAEVLMAEVVGVDSQQKRVLMKDRSIYFDYLIIATGARHGYFGHEEWEKYAPGLKSIVDATAIRRRVLTAFERAEMEKDSANRGALLCFAIVGGGPTGVEMAGAIAELAHRALASDFRYIDPKSARVCLLEAGPRVLPSFPEKLASRAQADLVRLGVEVRTNARVENVSESGLTIGGEFLLTRTVIWAAGVVASPAADWLGAEKDRQGRVKVLGDLSVPGHPNIFVIGDAAAVRAGGESTLPGLAPVAMQEGRYVAETIMLRMTGMNPSPFRYSDRGSLATIGRSSAVAVLGKLHLTGFIAWLAWLFVHIYYLIGFRNRVLVLFEWAWSYLTFQRGARLITDQEESRGSS